MLPGVDYPRDYPIKEGLLPPGWTAVEQAYKSGKSMGKTYVRFNSPHKRDLCQSLREVLMKEAQYNGATAEEIAAVGRNVDERRKAEKEAEKAALEAAGYVSGAKKDAAVAAFRARFGTLDGATACKLPGWRADSLFRESCGQTAVIYYNSDNKAFTTVKAIEAFYGVRVLAGTPVTEIDEARGNVVKDEKGRAVNIVRKEIGHTRTAAEMEELRDKRGEWARDPEAFHKKIKLMVGVDRYQACTSFSVVSVGADAAAAVAAGQATLAPEAANLATLLRERGFSSPPAMLALCGAPTGVPNAAALAGFFLEKPEPFAGKPCYQQVYVHESGSPACRGTFIYWSERRKRWKVGPLKDAMDNEAPFAYLPAATARPTETGGEVWMVYLRPDDPSSADPAPAS